MADMNLKENIPEQEEKGIAMEITFYFIGNSDVKEQKKEQEFTRRMLDKLLSGVQRRDDTA